MAYDGTIKIATELDMAGVEKGMKALERVVSSSALTRAIGALGKNNGPLTQIPAMVEDITEAFGDAKDVMQDYAKQQQNVAPSQQVLKVLPNILNACKSL